MVDPTGVAALAVHVMINTTLSGATLEVDGGRHTDTAALNATVEKIIGDHGAVDGVLNVAGIEKGSYRVVIGSDARMLDRLSRLAPNMATDMITTTMASLLQH